MKNLKSFLFASFVVLASLSSKAEIPGEKSTKKNSASYSKQDKYTKPAKKIESTGDGEVIFRTKSQKGCFKSIIVC